MNVFNSSDEHDNKNVIWYERIRIAVINMIILILLLIWTFMYSSIKYDYINAVIDINIYE